MANRGGFRIPRKQLDGTPRHAAWEVPGYRFKLERLADAATQLLLDTMDYFYEHEAAASVEWFLYHYRQVLKDYKLTPRICSLYDIWCFFTYAADSNLYGNIHVGKEDTVRVALTEHLTDQIAALAFAAMLKAGHGPPDERHTLR